MSDDEDLMNEDIDLGHYEGERNELGERHGEGKSYFPNGDTYDGAYDRGRRHGKGFYQFAKGPYYDGMYQWNSKQGQGLMQYPDGALYDGQWLDNCRHGRGKYTYINGDEYDGEWFNNVKHGKGTYWDKNTNSRLDGTWSSGRLNGEVRVEFGSIIYHGSYLNDLVGGIGKFVFPKLSVELIGKHKVSVIQESPQMIEEGEGRLIRKSKWESHCLRFIEREEVLS